jgi:hypothetical protein
MENENEPTTAIPTEESDAVFLNRHTPTGLFWGRNLSRYWVVETKAVRRAITLPTFNVPMFAVFTLSDRELDYGCALGKAILQLEPPTNSIEHDEVGIVRAGEGGLAMRCLTSDGGAEWVNLDIDKPTHAAGLFDCWKVFVGKDLIYPIAERQGRPFTTERWEPARITVEFSE